mgnify:CR=1 FL=1
MTFISVLLTLGCFILVFKAIARDTHSVQSKSADEQSDIDFVTVSEQLEHLNELKDNIQSIEDMITEIEICEPEERATAINISMPTNNTGIQIVANNSSDEILKLLHKERQKLRSSLAKEIANLQYRCNGNDNGNIEDLNRGGTK